MIFNLSEIYLKIYLHFNENTKYFDTCFNIKSDTFTNRLFPYVTMVLLLYYQKTVSACYCCHTGKCIRRFGGIYAYCRYFIDRKWWILVLLLYRKKCHMPKGLSTSIIFKYPVCAWRFM